jgi:WD40 repeat protein/tetratricopeptide (TPR) repeat protein
MRQLGKFQLLERVGLGAFGAVWKARDTELDRVVALKLPHASLLSTPEGGERFHREARAAAQLRHSGIVTVHEVTNLDGVPAIVSDFIDGLTLRDFLRIRQLTFRESATLVAQVAEALDYAHSMGLVHRDVKPGNIMMEYGPVPNTGAAESTSQAPSSLGRPLVMDFGLALRDEIEVTLTLDGQVMGTPAYMAPEQAAGHGHHVDRRCDVYSLGVILYELLCGELPFRGTRQLIIHQVLREEPRPPRRLNDRIPRDLETICLKALAKEPNRRYQSAAALAEDLRRFLAGEPITARPVGRVERMWRWSRRNPALASALGLAASALLLVAVLSALFAFWQSQANEKLSGVNAELREEEEATRVQKERAQTALQKSEKLSGELTLTLRQTQERSALVALKQAQDLMDQQQLGRAALWLARALELAPAASGDLQRVIRSNLADLREELITLKAALPHGQPVKLASFSPDGKHFLTGTDRIHGSVRIWETATLKSREQTLGYLSLQDALFSPDGKSVLTTGGDWQDRDVDLWDAVTGARLAPTMRHPYAVTFSRFSPDSRRILTTCSTLFRGEGRLWETATGRQIAVLAHAGGPVYGAAFSPDTKVVATGGDDGTARLWDAATGAPLGLVRPGGWVKEVTFTPDGKTLLTCNNLVQRWDVATRKAIGPPLGQSGTLTGPYMLLGPDGKTLLLYGKDHIARLWDVTTDMPVGQPLHHRDNLQERAALSPDGSLVATVDQLDRAIQLWDAHTGEVVGQPLPSQGGITQVAFSPNGRLILAACKDGTARLWQLPWGRLEVAGPAGREPREKVRWERRGSQAIQLLDSATGRPIGKPLQHPTDIYRVAVSPDGKTVVTTNNTVRQNDPGEARIWDATSGKAIGEPLRHQKLVSDVAFSPDSKVVATASHDMTAQLWHTATGEPIGQPLKHTQVVQNMRFSGDGKRLLTLCTWDAAIRIWDTRTTQLVREVPRKGNSPALLDGPDGKLLATWVPSSTGQGEADNRVHVLDSATLEDGGPPLQQPGVPSIAAFSPDGKLLLTGCADRTARLWEIATGRELLRPLLHEASVSQVAFAPDGRTLLTVSNNRVVRLFDTATGRTVGQPMQHDRDCAYMSFSPDGTRIRTAMQGLSGRAHEKVRWWDAATGRALGLPLLRSSMALRFGYETDGRTLLVGAAGSSPLSWEPVAPLAGEASLIGRWARIATGMELGADGAVGVLDGEAWQGQREKQTAAEKETSPVTGRVAAWHATRASRAEDLKQWYSALWHLNRLVALRPSDTALRDRRGRAHFELGQWSEAVEDFTVAIRASTNTPESWQRRGWAQALLNKTAEALEDFDRAFADSPEDAAGLLARYFVHARRGEWEKAEAGLTRALAGRRFAGPNQPLHHDRWEQAGADYTRAISAGVTDWWVWYGRATAYLGQTAHARAIEDYSQAIERKRDHLPLWFARASAHGQLRHWDKMAEDLSQVIKLKEDLVPAWQLRATAHANLGRWDRAAEDFTKVLDLHPADLQALAGRADALAGQGLWDKAEADLARVLEKQPNNVHLHHARAVLQLQRGDRAGYRTTCAELLRRFGQTRDDGIANTVAWTCVLAPDSVPDPAQPLPLAFRAAESVAQVARELPESAKQATYYNTLGAALYRAGRFEAAVHCLNEAMKEQGSGGTPADWLFLALAHHRLGQASKAKLWRDRAGSWVDSSTRDKPKDDSMGRSLSWGTWLELQLLRKEADALGELDRKATAELDRAVEKNPEDAAPWTERARFRSWRRRHTDALADYDKAIELRSKDAALRLERGRYHARLHQWEKATADLARAAELRPLDLNLAVECGHAHAAAGQWDRAVGQFEKVTGLGAASPPIWYWQALAQLGAGRTEDYRRTCKQMLDRYGAGTDRQAAQTLVQAYRLAPEALPEADRVIKLAEVAANTGRLSPMPPRLLGHVLVRAGRPADAVKTLNEVMKREIYAEQDLWFAPDALYLALAHHRLGHGEEARKLLAQARRRIEQAERDRPAPGAYVGPWADYWEKRMELGQTLFGRYALDTRPWDVWYNQLVLRLLLKETEALLNPGASSEK